METEVKKKKEITRNFTGGHYGNRPCRLWKQQFPDNYG